MREGIIFLVLLKGIVYYLALLEGLLGIFF